MVAQTYNEYKAVWGLVNPNLGGGVGAFIN